MAPRSPPLFHLSPIDGTPNVRCAYCCSEPDRVRRRSLPFRSADHDNPSRPAGPPLLPAGFHLRSWSADHSFLPARRPSVCYTALWILPLILVRKTTTFSRPVGRPSDYTALWILPLILVRRPQLSPGPSAVRLLYCPLDTTFDPDPQTTAFSRPVGRPSVILPSGYYL